jgi:iron complex outermembrane receptor protein
MKRWLGGCAASAIVTAVAATAASPATAQVVAPGDGSSAATPDARPDDTSGPASTDAGAPGLAPAAGGDIIVTAQRRSESLSRTPVAVSALSSEALQKQVITTQADLQSAVPGLQVKASQNSNQLNFAIRGQSLDPFSSVRPGVLPYFNEVQFGGSAAIGLYDLQSVQVVKGPQGTLFGRNATGGAVLFTSNRPTAEPGGYVLARGGNFSYAQAEGAVNVPLVGDKLLARVAGYYERRAGYQRNLFDGQRVGNVRRWGTRGSLTADLGTVKNDLVIDYLHSGGSSLSSVLYSILPIGASPPGAVVAPAPANLLFSPAVDAAFGPGAFARYLAAHPGADPDGILAFADKQKQRGPYLVNVDGGNAHRGRSLLVSNVTTIDLGGETQLKNVFGYTRVRTFDQGEFDGSPYGIDSLGPEGRRVRLQQVSDELQLLGKVLDGRLSYVGGLYYSSERSRERSQSLLFDLSPNAPGGAQINSGVTRNRSYAGYLQGTYDLADATGIRGLGVTLGGRYTSERVSFARNPDDLYLQAPDPSFVLTPLKDTFKKASYQIGLQDQINNDLLVYVVHRRSFRSGGFNFFSPPIPGFGNEGGSEYRPETATDIEIGAKFRGSVAGMPTRLNIAAYNLWNKNIQRVTYAQILGAPSAITVNVPRAEITGFEIDGSITPVTWLNVGGSLNRANGRFTSNLVSIAGSAPVAFGPFPDLPKWSGTIYAEVTAPVSGTIRATARGDVYAQKMTYFSSSARALNPGARIPGYALADFRIGVDDSAAGWSLSAVLKNAFNKVYYVGGLPFESVFALNTAVPGDRRRFIVEGRINF